MTATAVEILRSFNDLAANEQWSVAREILRRLQDAGQSMSDDELLAAADELFATLDEEEAGDGSTASGRNLAG